MDGNALAFAAPLSFPAVSFALPASLEGNALAFAAALDISTDVSFDAPVSLICNKNDQFCYTRRDVCSCLHIIPRHFRFVLHYCF
jgi:hypothetical protein